MYDKIIEKLNSDYRQNGFLTEEKIFAVLAAEKIPLFDVEYIMDALLLRGVIIRESEAEENEEDYDRSSIDYEAVFSKLVELEPSLEYLIDYARTIKAPRVREWQNLLPQAQNGNSFAISRLFDMYLRVVLRICLGLAKKYGWPLLDTIQDGLVGLLLAIQKYDMSNSGNFASYFPFWVRQVVMREAPTRNPTVYFPVHVKDKLFATYEVIDKHSCDLCDTRKICPNLIDKISTVLNCGKQEAQAIYGYLVPFESLECWLEEDDGISDDGIAEREMMDDIERSAMKERLLKVIHKRLRAREAYIIMLRYGLWDGQPHTLEMIGKKCSLTRERIRQIEAKAIRKLRSAFRKDNHDQ